MNRGLRSQRLALRKSRRIVEEKDKSLRPKLTTLEEAVKRYVKKGQHLALGGCLYSRAPMAAVHEIIRQGIKDLEVSRSLAGIEADLLMTSGSLRRLVTSWCSVGYSWGVSKIMRVFVEKGEVAFEEWSHLALGLRYKAAAMGIPFLPTLSMLGSDLAKVSGAAEILCPFTEEKVLLVPALFPDVAIIHVHRADQYGNAQIDGYQFMDQDLAKAAQHVIITCEELVDSEEFRRHPDRTVIPFFCVDAVVKVPYGAYPGECWSLYETDFDHFSKYVEMIGKGGVEGARRYLDKYVYGAESFEDFLGTVGGRRLLGLRKAAREVLG